MFLDLQGGIELDAAPHWLQNLWEECADLKESLGLWADCSDEVPIAHFISEFRKESYAYIKAGIIAHEVRLKGHYKAIAPRFSAFCEKWLGRSIWQVNRIIEAADVAVRLVAMGFCEIPANEAQCRPLIKLNDFDLEATWRKVCKFIPEKDRTAKAIEAAIGNLSKVDPDFSGKPAAKRIEIEADYWDILEQKARANGLSPKRYLELLLQKDLMDESEPEPELEPEPETKPKTKTKSKGFGGTLAEIYQDAIGRNWVLQPPQVTFDNSA